MKTMSWRAGITSLFCIFLTTACSKQLMPPEIENSANAIEGTDFTASGSTEENNSRTDGSADAGFFSEEPILEKGSTGSSFGSSSSSAGSDNLASIGSESGLLGGSGNENFGSSGQANIGNGSAGSFSANPFSDGSGGSGGSGGLGDNGGSTDSSSTGSMDSGIQESRLQSFQTTDDLKDIHFKFDKYDLDAEAKDTLKKNATFLKNNPNLHVEVQGHCDERGTNNYNIALGERRAHSTKQYLVSQGVDSGKVHVISYGEEKPFCLTSGESCWYQNRRAHFMVSK